LLAAAAWGLGRAGLGLAPAAGGFLAAAVLSAWATGLLRPGHVRSALADGR
jgi:hypothetical protein